jgi:hypothetical protein
VNSKDHLFVVLNESGFTVQSSYDADVLPLMKKYVRLARAAGDDWKLYEYKLSRVINCDDADTPKKP